MPIQACCLSYVWLKYTSSLFLGYNVEFDRFESDLNFKIDGSFMQFYRAALSNHLSKVPFTGWFLELLLVNAHLLLKTVYSMCKQLRKTVQEMKNHGTSLTFYLLKYATASLCVKIKENEHKYFTSSGK